MPSTTKSRSRGGSSATRGPGSSCYHIQLHMTRAAAAISSGVPFDVSTADIGACQSLLRLHRRCLEKPIDNPRNGRERVEKESCEGYEELLNVSCPPASELEEFSWSRVMSELVGKIKSWPKKD